MKKVTLLCLLGVLFNASFIQGLSWAYPFVVWEGKVYEVKQKEIILENDIGEVIGEVTTRPDDMTGEYYGNASNYYPKGTKYYEIKGTSASAAIAVKQHNEWVRAVYLHQAPFHIMNVLTHPFFLLAVGIASITAITLLLCFKKEKNV